MAPVQSLIGDFENLPREWQSRHSLCCSCPRVIERRGFDMGLKFGNLAKINGIVYFRLSPYEQKAFKGIISEGGPNLIRRFQSSVFRVAPFFMFTYLLMNWAKEKNHALSHKNPKDYENDT